MKIKDLCASERPREKMLSLGASSMSSGELLAILLRTGNRNDSALDLSQRLMTACEGHLGNLFNMGISGMEAIVGIGPGKATTILAALELGRRFIHEESSVVKRALTCSQMVYSQVLPFMKGLRHEECWVLLLNDSNYLICKQKVTSGGGRSTVIDVRQLIRLALEKNASSLVLVHNHPSGNPHPSKADLKQTDSLHKAANSCGLNLIDHIVVCDDCYYSFADDKVIR